MKFYEIIFYGVYKFCFFFGKKDTPEMKTVVILSIWDCFYVFSVKAFFRHELGLHVKIPIVIILLMFLFINVLHLLFLIQNGKYLKIYKKYERSYSRKKGAFILILFFTVPFLALIYFQLTGDFSR
jgi:hypothetical protein